MKPTPLFIKHADPKPLIDPEGTKSVIGGFQGKAANPDKVITGPVNIFEDNWPPE